jgi:hypothetical protein
VLCRLIGGVTETVFIRFTSWKKPSQEGALVTRRAFVAGMAALFGAGGVSSARGDTFREVKLHVEGMF